MLENLARIRAGIDRACDRAGRDPAGVRLVAVAKTVPLEAVQWVHEAGVTDIGENYVKELIAKRSVVPVATWHFVGTLQSHSAHHVAANADVVHTLTPGRAVSRLARRAHEQGRRLPALVEVDFTRGARAGLDPDAVDAFADEVAATDGLEIAGLMTLPPMPEVPEDARPFFRRLREMGEVMRGRHPRAAELSMGMSMDYEVAIEEGATMVRIGTALFGERAPAR
ncbi:MAG: YggS family pyridoxal phosphate-dependent enzyme [Actinomycetota bacterium]